LAFVFSCCSFSLHSVPICDLILGVSIVCRMTNGRIPMLVAF
jgi:hypothetical protein